MNDRGAIVTRMLYRLTSSLMVLVIGAAPVWLNGCGLSCLCAPAAGAQAERTAGCSTHDGAVAAARADQLACASAGCHHLSQADVVIAPSVVRGVFQTHGHFQWLDRPEAIGGRTAPAGGPGFAFARARSAPSSAVYRLHVLRL